MEINVTGPNPEDVRVTTGTPPRNTQRKYSKKRLKDGPEDEIVIPLQMSREEFDLLFDLCALQHETLTEFVNDSHETDTERFEAEVHVLEKFLDTVSTALERGK